MSQLEKLTTESRHPASERLDQMSAAELVALMNGEDATVVEAVRAESIVISQVVELVADRIRAGGRLVYLGCGTSGRLGVLDASECPPTFNTPPEMVVGIIAGGDPALRRSSESTEDRPEEAVHDLQTHALSAADVLIGIASSGRTPYVLGGLEYARQIGAATVGLTCNAGSDLATRADLVICPVVGPEILSGSTRMKAGTATKMILNMITTGTMVLLGKTYGNLMVDLRATNSKLSDRARRIVRDLTGLTAGNADALLRRCDGEVKTAILAHQRGLAPDSARQRLARCQGRLRAALELDTLSDT
ncbi:MAG: N-acetylmuramic acid 6-phosphate etherase [Planctomycetales bacterium]|nr:N-acetylmuramic acid 6-phosphate etherase [Planctomycetales bacterium]